MIIDSDLIRPTFWAKLCTCRPTFPHYSAKLSTDWCTLKFGSFFAFSFSFLLTPLPAALCPESHCMGDGSNYPDPLARPNRWICRRVTSSLQNPGSANAFELLNDYTDYLLMLFTCLQF